MKPTTIFPGPSTRKFLIFFLALWLGLSASAEITLGFPGEKTASVGIYVKDLRTGKVVASRNADKLLTPASITKSLTTATVMCLVDTAMRYATPVYLYGRRKGSTWDGNLVVEASGDPSLGSSDFPDSIDFAASVVNAVKEAGITQITGKVLVNEDLPDSGQPGTWEVEDVPWPYGAGLFGFNFMDNTMRLCPATGVTTPHDPGLIVIKQYAKNGGTLIRGINSDKIIAKGSSVRKPSWKLYTSMPNPARVFSHLLTEKLREAGVTVKGKETDNIATRMHLVTRRSEPLTALMRYLMFVSQNMYAEASLRLLAPGCTRAEAITVEKDFWKQRGIDTDGIILHDGSGLSRGNKFSPQFLGSVLEAMALDWGTASPYVSLFPKAGVEGTVKGLLADTPLAGSLALKSGSMGGVQCFAGYKLDANGLPSHVVVIMVNAFTCRRQLVREGIEKFLLNTFPTPAAKS